VAEFDTGVMSSESPTEPVVTADPSSGGTLNTQQPDQPTPNGRENWMPQARAEEMAQRRVERAMAQARQEFAAERQAMQQFFQQQSQQNQQALLQGLQQRAAQPSRTPEEERQRQEAQGALNGLLAENPEWTRMLNGSKAAPAMAQAILDLQEQFKVAEQRATAAHLRSETERLKSLASEAGISPAQYPMLERHVIGLIRSAPDAHKALLQGDENVIPWALGEAKKFFAETNQAARAALNANKSATRALPPRIGGTQPGATPPPQYDPKDPRGSMAKIHAAADAAYRERVAAGG